MTLIAIPRRAGLWCLLALVGSASAQDAGPTVTLDRSDVQQILDRLQRIEQENQNLAAELRGLRALLTSQAGAPVADSGSPPIEERAAVQEQRIAELAQTKVEASQKFPVKLTGTLLFNAFLNGRANGGAAYPTVAATTDNVNAGGARFTQSLVGFTYDGPTLWGGGKVNGSVLLDFAGGTGGPLNELVRLHVARLSIDWKDQSITIAQDKPIFSLREPTSLAQVSVSPLSGAGNPWLWQPQFRLEQRFSFGESTGVRAQAGVYQTSESAPSAVAVSASRPAFEGRAELWRDLGHGALIEIAPGFHLSESNVAGTSIPSRLFSVDWMIRPAPKFELTGLF